MVTRLPVDPATARRMDAVRGTSSIIVAAVHTVQIFLLPYFGLWSPIQVITSFLALGAVLAFFVISGFMINLSVANHTALSGQFDARAFALARIRRIYPPLIACILLSVVVYLLIAGLGLHGSDTYRLPGDLFLSREQATMEWKRLPGVVLLVYGIVPRVEGPISINGPLWSLSYEWWLYILCMVGVAALRDRRRWAWLALASVIALFVASRSTMLVACGVVWSAGYVWGNAYQEERTISPRFWIWPFATLVGAIVAAWFARGNSPIEDLLSMLSVRSRVLMTLYGLAIAGACAVAIGRRRSADVGMVLNGLASTSAFSYTLYVVHFPLLLLAFSFLHPLTHGTPWHVTGFLALIVLTAIIVFAKQVALVIENRALADRVWQSISGLPKHRRRERYATAAVSPDTTVPPNPRVK